MRKRIATVILSLLTILPFQFTWASTSSPTHIPASTVTNQQFRDAIIRYVRGIAVKNHNAPLLQFDFMEKKWLEYYQATDWRIQVSLYHQGQEIGAGCAHGANLAETLRKATEQTLLQQPDGKLTENTLSSYRFKITLNYYPDRVYSFIEYDFQGLELLGNVVAVRKLDEELIKQQIVNSQGYLLRMMHPELHGFFKLYDAGRDEKEHLLRTIYSASSLYTLLKLYARNKDTTLEKHFKPIANFILSNQVQDGPNAGAFYYGLNPKTNTVVQELVVGTTSKTIFTLIELDHFYPDNPRYLQAAIKAGDWLVKMVHPDGRVTSSAIFLNGNWDYSDKQSFLYSGQVLSALSRLYKETNDKQYYEGAHKIAGHFINEVKRQGPLLGDTFRPANSISSSWVMMSLIDYAKIDNDPAIINVISEIAHTLLTRQIKNKEDAFSNGRYIDLLATSGNGWVNEVMGVMYEFCSSKQLSNCKQYQQAMLLTSRWLLQNAYTKQNTYAIKNPEQAIGGFIRHFTSKTVRTDAVCHGVNSLISLLNNLGESNKVLLDLPERPLVEILPLLRAGSSLYR
jgi:hypothetical protein